jgi:hypothetical protein
VRPLTPPLPGREESRLHKEPPTPQALRRPPSSALQLPLWNEFAPAPPAPAQKSSRPPLPAPPTDGSSDRHKAPPDADLKAVFDRVFRRLRLRGDAPVFRAAFHAFTGLRSTIRVSRTRVIEARLSDLLAEARPLVLEAIAEILITRLYRIRTSREARECYQAWAHTPAVVRRIEEVRRERGRKRLLPPQGRCFDLKAIFDDLNRRHFEGSLEPVRIGWSPIRSRTMLGHYDSSHGTITITRWLDGPRVPRYVVEYLVFHEMLHVRIPVERRLHRRVVHPPEFAAAERAFPDYARATRWLRGGTRHGAGRPPWEAVPSI